MVGKHLTLIRANTLKQSYCRIRKFWGSQYIYRILWYTKPATRPFPELDESIPRHYILFLQDSFYFILPSNPGSKRQLSNTRPRAIVRLFSIVLIDV